MSDQTRYVLTKKIARGGMAEIFLGKVVGEDGFQRLCAIKRILPHYAQDQEFIQMFRDEAHICKRLQHANIVKVEGFEEVDGSYAIIMEFVDGADLRTLLHAIEQGKQKVPVPFACYIIAESARGLHYAHTKEDEITQQALGIVHRDISPQNILVSYEGEVKVTDFGIADAESKITETRPGIVKGKYSYMSPEQISAKQVDARTDVFALSIVLWEMLAMRRLFQGENEVDTIQKVKNCVITQEIREINPDVDEDLNNILKKGLAKDPKKRFNSAADFEKDLRRYMSRKSPDFTPEDLGIFLKKLMEARRLESAADIKRTLTETNLRPARKRIGSPSGPLNENSKEMLQTPISLVKPIKTSSKIPLVVPPPPNQSNRQLLSSVGNGNPGTKTTNNPNLVPFRQRRNKNRPWNYAIAAIIAGFVLLRVFSTMHADPKPAQLILRTQPSRVKISINNAPINRGHYVRANDKNPLRINLHPGQYVIAISRAGYNSVKLEINLEDGEKVTKDDIVLKEKSPLAAVKIKAKNPEQVLSFDIDDGYFIAKIIPGKSTSVAPDIIAGKTYKLKATDSEGSFFCKFTPHSVIWRQPNEVIIDNEKRKCTMTGPTEQMNK